MEGRLHDLKVLLLQVQRQQPQGQLLLDSLYIQAFGNLSESHQAVYVAELQFGTRTDHSALCTVLIWQVAIGYCRLFAFSVQERLASRQVLPFLTKPLVDRPGCKSIDSLSLQVPCSLIYGQSDWMKPENGKRVFADMEERRGKLDEADLQVIPASHRFTKAPS